MLNVLRAIVVLLGGISLLFILMDAYHILGFKMNNNTVKIIVFLTFIVCDIFFSIDGFLIWFNGR